MPVRPDDMLLVHAIATSASFAEAGRELGIRRQSVSERVARIEDALGVRLFERSTRTLGLTDAGRVYARRCATLAEHVREANLEVQGMQATPTGVLRVSAPVLYGRHLGPLVARLEEAHPALRFDLQLTDRFVDLLAEGIDVAIRVGDPGDSSLVARRIGRGSVQMVASPAWLERHGPVEPRDLEAPVCICQRDGETWQVGDLTVRPGARVLVNDIATACAIAAAGGGVARLPSFVHAAHVARGELVALFDGCVSLAPPIFAVFPSRTHLPAKVRVFVDAVADHARSLFDPSQAPPLVASPHAEHP